MTFRRPQFVILSSFVVSYGLTSTAVLLPLLAKERLGAEEQLLGVYGFLFNLPYIFLGFLAGNLLSRIGFRMAIVLSGLVMAIMALWIPFVDHRYLLAGPCLFWGVVSGLFWPAIEGANAEGQTPEQTKRGVSNFSVSWVTGALVGQTVNAWLYGISLYLPFVLNFFLGAGIAFLATQSVLFEIAPWKTGRPHRDEAVPQDRRRLFVRLAFIANFSLWVGVSCLRSLLPEYAAVHDLTGLKYGMLMSATMVGFLLANTILTHWHGWHYSAVVLLSGLVVAALAQFFFGLVDVYAGLLAAQVVYGAILGLTYFSSIYYGMELGGAEEGHGGRHEAIIGMACGFGALFGGWLITLTGEDRSPFLATAIFILCVVVFQWVLLRKGAGASGA